MADGLGPDFRPFISSIHSQPMMFFDELIHLIVRKDAFLKHHSIYPKLEESTLVAFAAKIKSQDSHDHRGQQNEYRGSKPSKTHWHRSKSLVVCQLCDIPGHSAKTCRKGIKALAVVGDNSREGNWILDSGASSHMTPNLNNLSEAQEYLDNNSITIGNGLGLKISHIGTLNVKTKHGNLSLKNALSILDLRNESYICSINV